MSKCRKNKLHTFKLLLVAFLLFFCFLSSSNASTPNSDIGNWHLENGTGVTVTNSGTEGAVLNGTMINMADPGTATSGWTTSGKQGNAINLDGIDDRINFGSDTSIDDLFNNDITISYWVKPVSCSTQRYMAGKSNGGAVGFYIFGNSAVCNPAIRVYYSTTAALYSSAPNSITPNEWNLVTFVWHASTKSSQIYVNGAEVAYDIKTPGVGTYVSDAANNLTFGTWGAGATTFSNGTIDEIKIYNYARSLNDIKIDAGYVTSNAQPVTVVKNMSYVTSLLLQMPGEPDNNFAEFRIKNIGVNNWSIQGLKIFDLNGSHEPYILNDSISVWEYASFLGIADDPALPSTNWGVFGNIHGNESTISYALSVDGMDITSSPLSSVTRGSQAIIDQNRNTLLPKDGSTIVGTTHLIHTLDSSGLLVDHIHTFQAGYQVYDFYASALPTDHSSTTGINRSQIGNNPIHPLLNNGSFYDTDIDPTPSALESSTNQPYVIRLILPSGGPDTTGDWSYDTDFKIWLEDGSAYGKVRVNGTSGGYPNRVAATVAARHYQTLYQVFKNISAPNGPDVDNDLIANIYDIDIDGDTILNGSDTDIDGDGILNALDNFPSGIGNESDIDADESSNKSDGDVDGDGFLNASDGDIDGDGIPNGEDKFPSGVVDVSSSTSTSSGSRSRSRIVVKTPPPVNDPVVAVPLPIIATDTLAVNTTSVIYYFSPSVLKTGSRGEAVKNLQDFLNKFLNLNLIADGIMGPKTTAAVKNWQAMNGLVVDGVVGPKTKAKMYSVAGQF